MKQAVSVTYYDGVISKPYQASLTALDTDHILVEYQKDGVLKRQKYHADQMSLFGTIGQRNPVIELENDARIELHSQTLPEWLPIDHKNFHHKVWRLERTPSLIIFSVVFVLALGFALIKWGVPTASKLIAFQLPENTLTRLGGQAEKYVTDYTKPSKLPQARQDQIRATYMNLVAENKPAALKFRAGDQLGANALALPNNTIILTDELVDLAHSDQEIIGVLAHEQAHLLERHSLQQALSSLGFSVLYIAITGDSSDLMTTVPIAIVGAGYSRKFEQESDLYALKLMHKNQIETAHFANFLQRMSEDAEEDTDQSSWMSALSSHPATEERIKMVRDFEANNTKQVAQ